MHTVKVKELMTENPVFIGPGETLESAAGKMRDMNLGFLPVGTADSVSGIITDRDIVIRAVAEGKNPGSEKVADYMTSEMFACNEEDFLEDAAEKMRVHKVSRLLVRNRQGHATGVLSFGGILRKEADSHEVAKVVMNAV